jgi:hypothetical protein
VPGREPRKGPTTARSPLAECEILPRVRKKPILGLVRLVGQVGGEGSGVARWGQVSLGVRSTCRMIAASSVQ